MRQTDAGKGYLRALFAIAIVGGIGYVAVRTVPVYVHNYELQDYIRQLAIRATVDRTSVEAVQNSVVEQARSLDLPVTRDNVKVTFSGNSVFIELDYSVPVDLKVYTLELHFTPSAENRAL